MPNDIIFLSFLLLFIWVYFLKFDFVFLLCYCAIFKKKTRNSKTVLGSTVGMTTAMYLASITLLIAPALGICYMDIIMFSMIGAWLLGHSVTVSYYKRSKQLYSLVIQQSGQLSFARRIAYTLWAIGLHILAYILFIYNAKLAGYWCGYNTF